MTRDSNEKETSVVHVKHKKVKASLRSLAPAVERR